jgi:hypothetical protein
MIDQALINILDEIKSKATIYKNYIRNRDYLSITGNITQLKDGEYFNTLGAKATIQMLIDKMVEYEHIRKYGAKE